MFNIFFQMIKQKVYLLLGNFYQLSNIKLVLSFSLFFHSNLFQLIVLLKPDFNCSSSFELSWVDKGTTEI